MRRRQEVGTVGLKINMICHPKSGIHQQYENEVTHFSLSCHFARPRKLRLARLGLCVSKTLKWTSAVSCVVGESWFISSASVLRQLHSQFHQQRVMGWGKTTTELKDQFTQKWKLSHNLLTLYTLPYADGKSGELHSKTAFSYTTEVAGNLFSKNNWEKKNNNI